MLGRLLFVAGFVVATAGHGSAEAGTPWEVEETTVTATRETRNPFDVPVAVTVVDRERVERTPARLLPDLLRGEPGIFVQQTTPGQGLPVVRGLIGSSVLTLVDGMRLNNAIFRPSPNQYFALVDPYAVERIEIVRGTSSTLYGSDAMGGVVNVLTPTPRFEGEDWQKRARVLGQFGGADLSRIGHAALEAGRKGFGLRAGGTFQRNDDLRGGEGRQEPSAYDSYATDGKLLFAGDAHELTVAVQYARQPRTPRFDELTAGFGQDEPSSATFFFEPNDRLFTHARYHAAAPAPWVDRIELDFSFQEIDDDRRARDLGSTVETRERNGDRLYGFDAEAATTLGEWSTWTYGFESYFDRVSSSAWARDVVTGETARVRARFADGSRLDSHALFLQAELSPHPRWTVIVGGRGSWFEIDVPRADREVGVRRTIRDGTGNFGLVYHLTPEVNLVANLGRGFRVPNVFDLSTLGPRPGNRFNVPSPALGPESVLGVDVGVKLRSSWGTAELFAFRSEVDDKIRDFPTGETTESGREVVFAANLDRVLLYGFEGGARLLPTDDTEITASTAYTYGEEVLPDGREAPADLVPPLQGQLGALARLHPAFRVESFVRFAGRQTRLSDEDRGDPRIDPNGTDAWFTLNAGVEWLLTPSVVARLRVENLLDRGYREHGSGIDAAGVNAIVVVDARF